MKSEKKKFSWVAHTLLALLTALIYMAAVIYYSLPHWDPIKSHLAFFLSFLTLIFLNWLCHRLRHRFRLWPYLAWLLIFIPGAKLFIAGDHPNDFQFIRPFHRPGLLPEAPPSAWNRSKLMLDQDVRWGEPLLPGAPLKINLDVPEHAHLSFAAGVITGKGAPKTLRLSLSLETPLEPPREIAGWELSARRHAWRDLVVDLSEFAGKRTTLTLDNQGEARDDYDPGPPYLFLTKPRVIVQPPDRPRPNVIIVVVDCLRYDAVTREPGQGETPLLYYRVRQSGVEFTRHYAQSSWTAPSVASLFTSLMPLQTGVLSASHFNLSNHGETIMDKAREAGYLTAGFSSNLLIQGLYNYDRGMDRLVFRGGPYPWWDSAERVNDEVLKWIEVHQELPFVIYIHYMDPHVPYLPPARYALGALWDKGLFRFLEAVNLQGPANMSFNPLAVDVLYDLYRAEIRYWDFAFNALLDRFGELGLLNRTLVIITADHGEEFLEHQHLGHGFNLYQEVIHAPLFILPGGEASPKTIMQITRNLDLAPTVSDFIGGDPPRGALGRSLMPFVEEGNYADLPPVAAVSELPARQPQLQFPWLNDEDYYRYRYWRAYIKGRSKLIEKGPDENTITSREFFDLEADPLEKTPIPLDRNPLSEELILELHRYFEALPGKQTVPEEDHLREDTIQVFRDLGYIQ